MAMVRSTCGQDVVVRHAGRRLRIGSDWTSVSDDALDRLVDEPGIEVVADDDPAVDEAQAKAAEESSDAPSDESAGEPESDEPESAGESEPGPGAKKSGKGRARK